MPIQFAPPTKALFTGATHEGFVTRVQSFMRIEVGFANKALLTNGTYVGFLARVQSYVCVQTVFCTERFLANSADVGRLTATHFHRSSAVVRLLIELTGTLCSKPGVFAFVVGMRVAGASGRASLCHSLCTTSRRRAFLCGTRLSAVHLPNWKFLLCLGACADE